MKRDYELKRDLMEALASNYDGVRIERRVGYSVNRGARIKIGVSGSNTCSKMQQVFQEDADEAADGFEPVNCFIGRKSVEAVLEQGGDVVILSIEDDGAFTLNGITFEEEEAPDTEFDTTGFMFNSHKVYNGEKSAVEEGFLPFTKTYSALLDEQVEVHETNKGRVVVGNNGFAIMEIDPELEKDDEVPFEESVADSTVSSAPQKEPEAVESTVVVESDEELKRVIRLLKGETFACVAKTKVVSEAISKVTAALGNKAAGPLSVSVTEEEVTLKAGGMVVRQIETTIPLCAVAFADEDIATTFFVNLERFAMMVKALEGVEEELRISLKDSRVVIKGEEVSFTLDTTQGGTYLKGEPDGAHAEFDLESFNNALSASCFFDEKANNEMAKSIYLGIDDGRPVLYSLDGHMASRAYFKGAFDEGCNRIYSLPPCVTRFKLSGASRIKFYFGESMFWIECKKTRYAVNYSGGKLMESISKFFEPGEFMTRIVLQAGEMKGRVALVDSVASRAPGVSENIVHVCVGKTIKVSVGEQVATVASMSKHEGDAHVCFKARILMKAVGVFGGSNNVEMFIREQNSLLKTKDISILVMGVKKV